VRETKLYSNAAYNIVRRFQDQSTIRSSLMSPPRKLNPTHKEKRSAGEGSIDYYVE